MLGRTWILCLLLFALLPVGVVPVALASAVSSPAEFKIAFFGDQGSGGNAGRVLDLVVREGADAVVHIGDFDYGDDPGAWEGLINNKLGANFPYFAAPGNHESDAFYGAGGYQEVMAARMGRLGLTWVGDLGARSSHVYQGIQFVLTAPDIFVDGYGDAEYAPFIREQLEASESIWRISAWHKNMSLMTAGPNGNSVGWGVYEESRASGAIIATAHDHVYSRTHLLSSCSQAIVASTSNTLEIQPDDPETPADEGRSFVFVSGLGGKGKYGQEHSGPQFASVYTQDQSSTYGALFGVFHVGADPRLAHFYFMNIDDEVIDDFYVRSAAAPDDPSDVSALPIHGIAIVVSLVIVVSALSTRGRDRKGFVSRR